MSQSLILAMAGKGTASLTASDSWCLSQPLPVLTYLPSKVTPSDASAEFHASLFDIVKPASMIYTFECRAEFLVPRE